ncbi:hypothetical protein F6Y02_35870 [Bacillus megaterium]|nr:hypothetical protein [Priestia megaterium]
MLTIEKMSCGAYIIKPLNIPVSCIPKGGEKNWLDVYFPALGLEPLQWLYEVVEQIKEAVKTK